MAGKCRPSSNSSPQHPPRHIERHHVIEKINIFNHHETAALWTFYGFCRTLYLCQHDGKQLLIMWRVLESSLLASHRHIGDDGGDAMGPIAHSCRLPSHRILPLCACAHTACVGAVRSLQLRLQSTDSYVRHLPSWALLVPLEHFQCTCLVFAEGTWAADPQPQIPNITDNVFALQEF